MSTVFVCKHRIVISPWQYYANVGEKIYHNAMGFLHVDSDGTILFSSGDLCLGDFRNSQKSSDFEQGFRMMTAEYEKCFAYDPADVEEIVSGYEKKIIIGGCGRSGTTLMLSILGAHSEIFAIEEETHAFYPPPFKLKRLKRFLGNGGKEKHWCEKTPKNILAYGKILAMLGKDARIVNMIRDPRDVVTSLHPNGGSKYWVPKDRWVEDNSFIPEDDRIMTVKFEDLICDPEDTLRKVCDHIEIEFEESLLHHERFTNVKSNIAWKNQATALGVMNSQSGKGSGRWDVEEVYDLMMDNDALSIMRRFGYT